MNGVMIVGTLLREYGPLTAVVDVESIKAGSLPEGVELPALLVRSVSLVDRQTLKQLNKVRSVERVSVAVRAVSYRDQRDIIKLVRKACAGFVGDKLDAERVSVLTAGAGPDAIGPGNTFEQTQDFKVSFDAAT